MKITTLGMESSRTEAVQFPSSIYVDSLFTRDATIEHDSKENDETRCKYIICFHEVLSESG